MKVFFLWHLICVNNLDFYSEHLILFTLAVSFLRSSFSNFMVWVILDLLDPLSLHHLLFSFVFPTVPSFICWPPLTPYAQFLSHLWIKNVLLTHREKCVHRSRSFKRSPHPFLLLFSPPPASLVSAIFFPSVSLSLTALLRSFHPHLFFSSVQLHSNPDRKSVV